MTEMVAVPVGGRTFTLPARAGLGDCAPSGRIRLDALARWLQDVAYGDVEEAGVADLAIWVVRRTRIRVDRFPRFGEPHTLLTYCSGIGRMWAERRTSITPDGAGEASVEAVSLWVHLDPVTRMPSPLTAGEMDAYGDAAAGRRVSARLRHPPAPEPAGVSTAPWTFRATELDLANHVNNAAYWQPLEDQLLTSGAEPQRIDAEIEYRSPAQPGVKVILRNADHLWIVGSDGDVHASLKFGA